MPTRAICLARAVLLLLALRIAAPAANYFYDAAGHLIKVDYGAAGVVVYTYDNAGNLATRQIQSPQTANANTPVITSVVNAGGGNLGIAPNTWMAVRGTNLAPAGDTRVWQAADFAGNQLPVQLDGVGVSVNGKNAFIYRCAFRTMSSCLWAHLARGFSFLVLRPVLVSAAPCITKPLRLTLLRSNSRWRGRGKRVRSFRRSGSALDTRNSPLMVFNGFGKGLRCGQQLGH